jgi:hypothetical protein
MLELCGGDINLDRNPELIQPPKVDDNIVYIKLVPIDSLFKITHYRTTP